MQTDSFVKNRHNNAREKEKIILKEFPTTNGDAGKKKHESNKNVKRFTVTQWQCRKTNGHDRTTNYMYNQNAFRDNIYHTMT